MGSCGQDIWKGVHKVHSMSAVVVIVWEEGHEVNYNMFRAVTGRFGGKAGLTGQVCDF